MNLSRRLERLEHALECPQHHVKLQCPQCVPSAFGSRTTLDALAADVRQRIAAKLDEMAARMDAAKDLR